MIRTITMPRRTPYPARLQQTGEIVSARIFDCTDMAGFPTDCPGLPAGMDAASTSSPASTGSALFTSPNAYSSGTGLGPLTLPSFLSASLANPLASWFLIAAAVVGGVLVLRR